MGGVGDVGSNPVAAAASIAPDGLGSASNVSLGIIGVDDKAGQADTGPSNMGMGATLGSGAKTLEDV